ncbi:MAG: acyltransferase [Christensenella sp.]|nr:acyltransferase [Christensenella sp.]
MEDKNYYAHETCIIDEGCEIGGGTRIWCKAHIMSGVVIGEDCNIGENAFIESGVTVGNGVKIKNNVALYSGVVCEDDVFLGPSCVFTNVLTPRSFISRKNEFRTTLVRRGATVGANATIVCGRTLGRYSMIGAGSVVTKDVPDYTLVIGNPAKFHAYVCKCGAKLNKDMVCTRCENSYKIINNRVMPIDET